MNAILLTLTVLCVTVTLGTGNPHKHVCLLTTSAEFSSSEDLFQEFCQLLYGEKDQNNDHMMIMDEFLQWNAGELSDEAKKSAFLIFDTNGDDVIDIKDDPKYFEWMDTDEDDTVSDKEFMTYISRLIGLLPMTVLYERTKLEYHVQDLTKDQFEDLFSTVPSNITGTVTKSDLQAIYVTQNFGSSPHSFNATLELFDTNKDDVISQTEVGAQFDLMDSNDDGQVTLRELVDYCIL